MPDLKLKVSVSTGLYGIARGEEIATIVRKIGFGLTRGTSAIEISGDVPHEIDFTEGKELRYIAGKQGIDLNFHGSLSIPFCISEMVQWKEAQDHAEKSIKSAVYGGCKYVDFHACLHFWVEMLTYTGARLEIMMADWKGRFINAILAEDENLREYFIERFWDKYGNMILGEGVRPIYYRSEYEAREIVTREATEKKEKLKPEELGERIGQKQTDIQAKLIQEKLRDKLKKKEDWYYVARERGDYADAVEIVAHYLFFRQDPIWVDMVKMYEKELKPYVDKFGPIDPSNKKWLRKTLELVREKGDRHFKEFYYGTVSAKMLQGHLMALARWMAETKNFKGNGLPSIIKNELKIIKPRNMEKEYKELMDVLKNLVVAIEMPDARDPSYAGRYMIWRTKQIYVAIKHTREEMKKEGNPFWDKIMMLVDFEHLATQAVDPLEEIGDLVNRVPDVGKVIKTVHANRPTPLHSHYPLELGDDLVYRLLWMLTKAGLGKGHTTYLVFERGGFKDPFKQAVTTLKLIVRFLNKNINPDNLPPEFYGIHPKGLLAEERQWVTIVNYIMAPLKGTLKIPEEEYTAMSKAAIEEGKKPEEFKKEEFR